MTELLEGQFHNKELPAPRPKRKLWIIAGLAVLVLIGAGIYFALTSLPKPLTEAEKVRAKAWATFQEYLAAARAHDIEKVKSLSYQTSEQCKDQTRFEECKQLMDGVVGAFGNLRQDELPFIWYDDRQLVLRSDVLELEGNGNRLEVFAQLVFVREGVDTYKVLGGYPGKTASESTEGQTEEEVSRKLDEQTRDTDQDGLEDSADPLPTVRDTDGDGWWDGVEKHFR